MSVKIIIPKPPRKPLNVGEKRGRLTFVEEAERVVRPSGQVKRRIKCQCECGNFITIELPYFRSGHTKSCGCLSIEVSGDVHRTHGETATPLHGVWNAMKRRCNNRKCKEYPNYGGRGITVCEKWNTFEGFCEDMKESYVHGLSLDRVDVNGNYEFSNTRWITIREQQRNKRNNVRVTYNGVEYVLVVFCEKFHIKYSTLHGRLNRGMHFDAAISDLMVEESV